MKKQKQQAILTEREERKYACMHSECMLHSCILIHTYQCLFLNINEHIHTRPYTYKYIYTHTCTPQKKANN